MIIVCKIKMIKKEVVSRIPFSYAHKPKENQKIKEELL